MEFKTVGYFLRLKLSRKLIKLFALPNRYQTNCVLKLASGFTNEHWHVELAHKNKWVIQCFVQTIKTFYFFVVHVVKTPKPVFLKSNVHLIVTHLKNLIDFILLEVCIGSPMRTEWTKLHIHWVWQEFSSGSRKAWAPLVDKSNSRQEPNRIDLNRLSNDTHRPLRILPCLYRLHSSNEQSIFASHCLPISLRNLLASLWAFDYKSWRSFDCNRCPPLSRRVESTRNMIDLQRSQHPKLI